MSMTRSDYREALTERGVKTNARMNLAELASLYEATVPECGGCDNGEHCGMCDCCFETVETVETVETAEPEAVETEPEAVEAATEPATLEEQVAEIEALLEPVDYDPEPEKVEARRGYKWTTFFVGEKAVGYILNSHYDAVVASASVL